MKIAILGVSLVLLGTATLAVHDRDGITLLGDATGKEGEVLSFSVFVDEPGSDALGYTWEFGDGSAAPSGAEETAVGHRFMKDSTYTVSVRVSDGQSASMEVFVEAVRPTITVLSDDAEDQTVRFQGEATDPGDDELTYIWDFGDGTPLQEGIDLKAPSHTYARPGNYTVTLRVRDEDDLEDMRVLGVGANPGFLGGMSGEVERAVAGESGKASLMNALPGSRGIPLGNAPIFTGSAPIGGGVADLSEAGGVCFVTAGFWDDENKVHVNFMWTPNSDSVLYPRTYAVGWAPSQGDQIPPDQLLVNALVLDIEPSYEDTKGGAEDMEIFSGRGGIGGAISTLRGLLGGGARGGVPPLGPGRNYTLSSNSGLMRITKVTHERIYGEMDVNLRGAWMENRGPGTVSEVRLQGSFAWEMDEPGRISMARCGGLEFGIDTHTPWVDEEQVDFREPKISLALTLPYQRETVDDNTFQVGWLSKGGSLNPIDGEIVHDDDDVTIHFIPAEPLDDALFYEVRVRGGSSGILSESDEELEDNYEWQFSTIPELVRKEGGGGSFEEEQEQEQDAWKFAGVEPLRGRSGGPGWRAPMLAPLGEPLSAFQLTQKECDRTDEDDWSEVPVVDVLVYQTSCNQKLIPGKPGVVRVYLNWTYDDDKKGVDQYTTQVWLLDAGQSAVTPLTGTGGSELSRQVTVRRQELYSEDDREKTLNSVNFNWAPGGSGVHRVKAQVKAAGTTGGDLVVASQVRTLQTMGRLVDFDVPIVFAQVGSWKIEGIPDNVRGAWTGQQDKVGDGIAFAEQNYPVTDITHSVDAAPLELASEPGFGSQRFQSCGPNGSRRCMYYDIDGERIDSDDWLEEALINHYTRAQGSRPHLIVAIVPDDFGGAPAWAGVTKQKKAFLQPFYRGDNVDVRSPAVILIKAGSNPSTLTHELGHYLGLKHSGEPGDRDPGIEGLRIEANRVTNKSSSEGNGRGSALVSLMRDGDDNSTIDASFIQNEQYEDLLEDLEKDELWVQASLPASMELDRGTVLDPRAELGAIGRWTEPWVSGPSAAAEDGRWTAAGLEGHPFLRPRQSPHLLITGFVSPGGAFGHLDPLATLDGDWSPPEAGDYRLRLVGAGGGTVSEIPFEPERESMAFGELVERSLYHIDLRVPTAGGVRAVQILDPTGAVVAERSAGASAPEVRFFEDGGRVWESGRAVRWEGSDPDGDPLSYTLSYRSDRAGDWRTIVSDVTETEVIPDGSVLPPGADPQLRLTASDGVNSTTIESDDVRPALAVTSARPGSGAEAPVTTAVRVHLSGALDVSSLPDDALRLMAEDASDVEGTVRLSENGRELQFWPSAPLLAGTGYLVQLGDGLRDPYGNELSGESWSFTTEADLEAPWVVRHSPRAGAIALPVGDPLFIEFSESMDDASLDEGVVVRDADGERVSGSVAFDGIGYAAFLADEPYEQRGTYTVTVNGAATDVAGNSLSEEVSWTFTTAGAAGPRRRPGG